MGAHYRLGVSVTGTGGDGGRATFGAYFPVVGELSLGLVAVRPGLPLAAEARALGFATERLIWVEYGRSDGG